MPASSISGGAGLSLNSMTKNVPNLASYMMLPGAIGIKFQLKNGTVAISTAEVHDAVFHFE